MILISLLVQDLKNRVPCKWMNWVYYYNTCRWCVIGVNLHQTSDMSRQSISFTEPNDEWLKAQVDSKEYSSKSELVNDLIRQARKQQQQKQIDWISAKLGKAEESGFTNASKSEILAQSKSVLNG